MTRCLPGVCEDCSIVYKVSYDLDRPWKEVMEDLAQDDVHEEFYRSRNPLVSYLHRRRLGLIRELVESNGCRSVLEVGCGDGFVLEAIADLDVDLAGVEISEVRVARANARAPRAKVVQGDARSLRFPPRSFDVTICTEVLEHVPQPEQAVRELERVTKRRGSIIVTVPNERNWRLGRAALLRFPIRIPDHVNAFRVRDVNRLFARKPTKIYCIPPLTSILCLTYVLVYRVED